MSAPAETPSLTATAPPAWRWVHVGVAAAAMVATLPGRTHGLGLITVPLLTDLQLGEIPYAALNLWTTLIGAVLCLPVGWLIDRLGTRWVLAGVSVALGVVVVLMSGLTAGGSVTIPVPAIDPKIPGWFDLPQVPLDLFLLVTLTRGLGQSALSVISLALMGKAGGRKAGAVVGVYSFVMAIGFMIAFTAIKEVIEAPEKAAVAQLKQETADRGEKPTDEEIAAVKLRARAEHPGLWRTVWGGIGWSVLGAGVILPWFVRRLPEAVEPTPDDDTATRPSHTLGEALLTPGFWVFGLAVSFYGMLSSGLSLFNQSVLAERQFDREVFYTLTAVGPLVGLGSNLLTGLLARLGLRLGFIMGGALALQGVALVLFPFVTELWQVYAYGVTMGVSGGALTVVFFAYWGQAYGPKHLGRIQGIAQMLTVLASAAGPLVLAAGKERLGSYSPVMQYLSVVSFVFAALSAIVPTPKPPPPEYVR